MKGKQDISDQSVLKCAKKVFELRKKLDCTPRNFNKKLEKLKLDIEILEEIFMEIDYIDEVVFQVAKDTVMVWDMECHGLFIARVVS